MSNKVKNNNEFKVDIEKVKYDSNYFHRMMEQQFEITNVTFSLMEKTIDKLDVMEDELNVTKDELKNTKD
ncbi:hypothetical protein C1645_792023 [Glomus cerebriforme]|uniref:Uncharacterized protein n=1 Tax=Glomus cerebriforme TaxID=658196 RepID=A0A397S2R7_9GLOM|nr:hypothetical protein C1645_792023 [Glomus cerebriforme]